MEKTDKKSLEDRALDSLFSSASLPEPREGFADEVMQRVLVAGSKAKDTRWSWKEWLLPALQLSFSVFVFVTYDWTANAGSNLQESFVDTDMILLESLPSQEGLKSSTFNFSSALGLSTEDLL